MTKTRQIGHAIGWWVGTFVKSAAVGAGAGLGAWAMLGWLGWAC